MDRIEINGTSFAYRFDGPEGRPVVTLSHSLSSDYRMWDGQIAALTKRWRVLRFDSHGHGQSAVPPPPYALSRLAADVAGLLDRLGIAKTLFVGLSMGGMIGQLLGLDHADKLLGLALCCTTSRLSPEAKALWDERLATVAAQGMDSQVDGTLGRWFTPDFRANHPDRVAPIAAQIRATPPDGFIGWGRAIQGLDLTDRLGAIGVPTLVLSGALDPGTPPAAGQAIADRIPGARFQAIAGASHLANVEQPEAFTQALVAFLEGVMHA
ncbi:MAG: 3-oxoadipate enol-lactonase [Rhodospirillales bacterium]|nr:3-oxoadipate enol-lactonase [Rhodospirillales bacterium]